MSSHNKVNLGSASNPSAGPSVHAASLPFASSFNFQQGDGASGQSSLPQMYVDPETIQQQKESSIAMIDSQGKIAKDRAKAEYDSQIQAVSMRAEIENSNAISAIEQAKYQALFALDQQHQQRKLEIEQRAQEQKLQIEATSSQLIMQAQQQRLQREMEEKLAKLQASVPQHMLVGGQPGTTLFGTSTNLNGGMSFMSQPMGGMSGFHHQFYNPYSSYTAAAGPATTTTTHAAKGN